MFPKNRKVGDILNCSIIVEREKADYLSKEKSYFGKLLVVKKTVIGTKARYFYFSMKKSFSIPFYSKRYPAF